MWAQHSALSRPGLCQGGAGTGAIQAPFTLQSPVPQAGTALRDMASCRLPPGSTCQAHAECFSKENRFWGKERPPTLAFAHTQPRPRRKARRSWPGLSPTTLSMWVWAISRSDNLTKGLSKVYRLEEGGDIGAMVDYKAGNEIYDADKPFPQSTSR